MNTKEVIEIVDGLATPITGMVGVIVALVTILLSRRTARDTIAISQRQVQLEQAKVRSDLFDRRYDAWLEMRGASERRYQAVRLANPTDPANVVITRQIATDFRNAADKLYFLFGDDVNKAVTDLNGLLTAFHVARAGETSATGQQAQLVAQQRTLDADQAANEQIDVLRQMIKVNMQVGV